MIREHCMRNFVTCSSYNWYWQKVCKGELWVEVTHVTIGGHMRVSPSMFQVIWDRCLSVIFPSVTLFKWNMWGVILGTFENVHHKIWPTCIHIEQWNCGWWNEVMIREHCDTNFLVVENLTKGWWWTMVTLRRF